MTPLHRDLGFTFRFADDRIIPRFHLEGPAPGLDVSVVKIDAAGERLGLLATAVVEEGGWVDLPRPIVVRRGEGLVAVPMLVRRESASDHDAVRHIHRRAFGRDDEAYLVDAIRQGGHASVSMVAEIDGQTVGHILFSRLTIVGDEGSVEALALAPMAVSPDCQKLGVGSVLVRRGLEVCKEDGHRIIVVLGHANFYPRFGFSAKLAELLQSPYGAGPSHMALELTPGALRDVHGKLKYAPPFGDLE